MATCTTSSKPCIKKSACVGASFSAQCPSVHAQTHQRAVSATGNRLLAGRVWRKSGIAAGCGPVAGCELLLPRDGIVRYSRLSHIAGPPVDTSHIRDRNARDTPHSKL
jgi:hypothetical protein